MKKIKFDPGSLNYELVSEKRGAFEKRNVAGYPINDKARAKLLLIKSKFYDLLFANQKKSYLSRNLKYSKKVLPSIPKEGFLESEALQPNEKQIYFNSHHYLNELIQKLKRTPQILFEEANKINQICSSVNYEIPMIKAFNSISNWSEFIDLLQSINESKEHKFEFAIAAIVQYASLCQPYEASVD